MTKTTLDYDALLNDWAEELHKKVDKAREMEGESETGSYKHGHCVGYCEGLLMALAQLSLLEKRKTKNYTINIHLDDETRKGLDEMSLQEGKNYKLVNEFGTWYDIQRRTIEGKPMRVYGKFDLLVDGNITASPEDFWLVMHDLDDTTFAVPLSGDMLAIKLMTRAFVPIEKSV